jgi:hypothetical protein
LNFYFKSKCACFAVMLDSISGHGESRYLALRGEMTVIGSLVASTLWHVLNIYPLTCECIDSLQSEIWKFVWSKKPEWVRRETCMSDYLNGSLRIINLDIKSKALLIGCVFRFNFLKRVRHLGKISCVITSDGL